MGKKLSKEEVVSLLNGKLKELVTYEDFTAFEELLEEYSKDAAYEPGFMLYGKRNKHEACGFGTMRRASTREYFKNRVDYIYNDSKSSGECEICNLYKVMEVKHRW